MIKNKIHFSIILLIFTGLTVFFFYELLNNLDSGNIANVTANNNVIANQIAEISNRDSSNITSNLTSSDNSTTVLPSDTKSTNQLAWAIGAFAFVIVLGLIVPPVLEHYFGPAARQVGESIEMQTIPERVING